MWNDMVEPERPQMTVGRMRIACWTPKARGAHSECVIISALGGQLSVFHDGLLCCLNVFFSILFATNSVRWTRVLLVSWNTVSTPVNSVCNGLELAWFEASAAVLDIHFSRMLRSFDWYLCNDLSGHRGRLETSASTNQRCAVPV